MRVVDSSNGEFMRTIGVLAKEILRYYHRSGLHFLLWECEPVAGSYDLPLKAIAHQTPL